MNIRLAIDHHATIADWHVVQKWDPELKRWALVSCGLREEMTKLYRRLSDGKPQYEVIETTEEPKSLFKAREAAADLKSEWADK